MKQDLQDALFQAHPKILGIRNNPDSKLPIERYGFSCGDGWFHILDALLSTIQEHLDHVNRARNPTAHGVPSPVIVQQVKAVQIKEKFGGLRFYYDGGDDYIIGCVAVIENLSCEICDVCGAPGKRTSGGWIRTLCDTHRITEPR